MLQRIRLSRRLLLLVTAIVLLATAIEYGLLTASTPKSVATEGTVIVES